MKFRKKPVVIDAEQFWPDRQPLPFADRSACCLGPEGWYVVTAHGQETRIAPGDWIIPEPDGRGFYPCKPDIFAETHEPATIQRPTIAELETILENEGRSHVSLLPSGEVELR